MAEYIEKQAFLEHMKKTNRYFDVKFDIEDFPTADVAPVRHGRWMITDTVIENAVCSCCGKHFQSYYEAYFYCPNCGAKMDLEAPPHV